MRIRKEDGVMFRGGCVDCIYESKGELIEYTAGVAGRKKKVTRTVSPATQTVKTKRGQRDLCDRHAEAARANGET